MLSKLLKEIKNQATPTRAKASAWFFKTGKGQYGEVDVFVGLSVPVMRSIAKKYLKLSFPDLQKLLNSEIHEHRFIALEILDMQFASVDKSLRKKIVDFYLKNTKRINNWDLVDTSAPYILGEYLLDKPRGILIKLAKSKDLWERRIAIVSTQKLISHNQYSDALEISEMLLNDKHDLIHKAVGWMLREVGKKNEKVLLRFLDKHYKIMPRTALRYSIERLPEKLKKYYMKR